MSKIYTKLALGFLGYVTLTQSPIMCAEKQQVDDRMYCSNAYCWSYAKDCKPHNPVQTKVAQAAVAETIPTMRRCNSTTHCSLPTTMSCVAGRQCARARLHYPHSWRPLAAINL